MPEPPSQSARNQCFQPPLPQNREIAGLVDVFEEWPLAGLEVANARQSAFHGEPDEALHGAVRIAQARLGQREAGARINGGERLEPAVVARHAAGGAGRGLAEEERQEIRGHRRQIDREDEDERVARAAQGGFQASERAEAGEVVGENLDARAGVWAVGFSRDEKLVGMDCPERGELALPERPVVDEHARLVPAHARGFSTGEEDGSEGRR